MDIFESYTALVSETIKASETNNDQDALQTVLDGKRHLCFLTLIGKDLWDKIHNAHLEYVKVKGNKYGGHIVYIPGSEQQVKQLLNIAEKNGGYLPVENEEETREIGKLLEYSPEDIEAFIIRHRREGSFIKENVDKEYSLWKRRNVTYRGMKEIGQPNSTSSGVLGRGLYVTPPSNKSMSKQYGTVYLAVNGRPKHPKVFNTVNQWEIWSQNYLFYPYSKALGKNYPDRRDFDQHTTIEDAMQKLGYDGIEIKGREMVNYKPENVMFFRTERELMVYFDSLNNFNQ